MRKLTWQRSRCGGTVIYSSGEGHRVIRFRNKLPGVHDAIWHAFRPGSGNIVLLDTNDDGTPFSGIDHPEIRKPQARRFQTCSAAKRYLEAEL